MDLGVRAGASSNCAIRSAVISVSLLQSVHACWRKCFSRTCPEQFPELFLFDAVNISHISTLRHIVIMSNGNGRRACEVCCVSGCWRGVGDGVESGVECWGSCWGSMLG